MSYKFTIPEYWIESELQDFCVKVADGTHDSPKKTEQGKLLVTSKNIVGGTLDLSKSYCISEDDFNEVNRRSKVEVNDVLLSMIGTVGEACLIESEPDFAIKNVGLLKNDDPLKAKWLYFYLTAPQAQALIKERLRGTTQQYLPLGEVRKFPIIYPKSRNLMREVVGILGGLQNKIQLNHQISQTLEQMAQAIFKSWFVDFEPVKARIAALEAGGSEEDALLAAMQAISGKGEVTLSRLQAEQPEQYSELRATAELFPAAMQDSELGEIPVGWEALPLSQMINLIGGGTPKKSESSFWNGDIRWFSVKDVPSEGNVFVVETEDKITQEGLDRSSTKLLPIGTTIITARGTVGKLALTGVSTAMNQSCYGVTAKDGTGPYLNYLRLSEAVATLKRNTHGAVFDTITRDTFDTVIQPRACLALRQRFEQAVTPMFESIRNNLVQSKTLSEARDSLLPKLLSGELSVLADETQSAEAAEPANV